MKEYSKSALRRHKKTEQLRERRTARRRGPPVRAPLGTSQEDADAANPMNLIRREIAIMKKLDHPNIVTLIEVLDDPQGDSLYMILEWCGMGAIMPVDLDKDDDDDDNAVKPGPMYTPDQCRLYFRDMILGIEYLHSQGVIHRDIKADNLLLDEDEVVKIADFGVSEILDPANDTITKNAGSPAYMAPELAALSSSTTLKEHAASKGIDVSSLSGKSTDIWSMGVTLYLLVFGVLPFRSHTMVDLFDKIVNEDVHIPESTDPNLADLFSKILAKAPRNRITMDELREHPWVTHNGEDLLLCKEENTSDTITPVTEEDMYYAIKFVQGIMEPEHAMAKLRRLHGWRGTTVSNSRATSAANSREASASPPQPATLGRTPSPMAGGDETVSLYKLTRALEEVVSKVGHIKDIGHTLPLIDDASRRAALLNNGPHTAAAVETTTNIFEIAFEEPLADYVGVSRRSSRKDPNSDAASTRSLDAETRL